MLRCTRHLDRRGLYFFDLVDLASSLLLELPASFEFHSRNSHVVRDWTFNIAAWLHSLVWQFFSDCHSVDWMCISASSYEFVKLAWPSSLLFFVFCSPTPFVVFPGCVCPRGLAGVFQPVCTLIDPPGPVRAFLLVFWTVLALGVFNCARIVAIM